MKTGFGVQRRRIRSVVVSLGVMAALMTPGLAAAIQGIGVSPTSQELALNPGQTMRGQITVINDGDNDITYKTYAADYAVTGEQYRANFINSGKGPSLSAVSWFLLPVGTAVVKARQEATLNYTLAVPKTAAVGGHYAAVFVQTVPPQSAGAAVVNRIDRVASLFYIAVGGNLSQHGSILPLDVPWLQAVSPVRAGVRLKNSGNVHFPTELTAQLSSPFGKVGKPEVIRGEVLPSTTRLFDVQLPAPYPVGVYKVDVTVKYLGKSVQQSHWLVLIPRVTFLIISATILLLVTLGMGRWLRRLKRKPQD